MPISYTNYSEREHKLAMTVQCSTLVANVLAFSAREGKHFITLFHTHQTFSGIYIVLGHIALYTNYFCIFKSNNI